MSMNPEIFSPFCQKCLDGDYRDGPTGSHQRHCAELRRERASKPPPLRWRWKQVK